MSAAANIASRMEGDVYGISVTVSGLRAETHTEVLDLPVYSISSHLDHREWITPLWVGGGSQSHDDLLLVL